MEFGESFQMRKLWAHQRLGSQHAAFRHRIPARSRLEDNVQLRGDESAKKKCAQPVPAHCRYRHPTHGPSVAVHVKN